MFAVRLRVFVDWHRDQERDVVVTPPTDPATREVFEGMQIDPGGGSVLEDDAIMPVTRLNEFREVEEVAEQTREILEYQLPDVSPLGEATFMAISELCGNAIDHGRNSLGAYAAVRRITQPRRQVSIAISDLGIGVPEHIRQRYPEWSDDGWAIAHATEDRVTGTDDPHRGIGFSAVLEAALTTSLHAARMDLLSASGFCRVQMAQEKRKVEVFPAARFRRGTWITYDLISV
ncbi:MAG: hypothetical protein H0X42_13450 [Solirubrobacterales bacterium]|nr:hypothetical protein [Solirubrobacterales bacterium]